jgi:hypothetical protein
MHVSKKEAIESMRGTTKPTRSPVPPSNWQHPNKILWFSKPQRLYSEIILFEKKELIP